LAIIQDQAKTITSLGVELRECKSDHSDQVQENARLKELVDKQALKINELNNKLTGGKKMSLHELQKYRDGLPTV
jgi:uncharacterized coiled-coil DUF342 family protein